MRRTLELADPATLVKVARVRARVRAHVWSLICARPAGFPWLAIAGKVLAGWLVIDLDGTLITARSDKEGAAPTFKMGYGFHPLGGLAFAGWQRPVHVVHTGLYSVCRELGQAGRTRLDPFPT